MRSLRLAIAAIGLAASTAFASPADPKVNVDYVVLPSPQPVQQVGKKVEVIEFFMYHCPHCNALEPELEAWIKKQGDNINFKRMHFPSSGPLDAEAHLYLTLEALGKVDEMQGKVFKAFHAERILRPGMKDEMFIDWVGKNGIDKAKFSDAWNSFGVKTKLNRLTTAIAAYKVDSAPTIVVDGKYMTSPSILQASNPNTNEVMLGRSVMQVLDALVNKAKTGK